MQIKNRLTSAVIFECELPPDIAERSASLQLGYTVKEALKAGADLSGADLSGAYLRDADLSGADLSDADLRGAYLRGAYLRGADLSDADLRGAYLRGAYLSDADLRGADLSDADLSGAYLSDADLSDADLRGAYLRGAYLRGADLSDADLSDADLSDADLSDAVGLPSQSTETEPEITPEQFEEERKSPRWLREQRRAERYRSRNPDVPVIKAIDQRILSALEAGGTLEMSRWHGCGTTHCRAGWAITLAGDKGAELEDQFGPSMAGRMIYRASAGYCPHFFASNEAALEDIKSRAAEQSSRS